MTIPLVSNTSTNQLWWGITNQLVGVVNQLTDGSLFVNGAITFTNSQFSLSAPSMNIANTLGLTAPSGNSFFLFSSNAVVNGTMFLTGSTGQNNSLYVANNAIFNGNLTALQTISANNLTVLNIDHLGTVYANGPGTALWVANNAFVSGNVTSLGSNSFIQTLATGTLSANSLTVSNNFTINSSNGVFSGTLYANSPSPSFVAQNDAIFNGNVTVAEILTTNIINIEGQTNLFGTIYANGVNYSINVSNSIYTTGAVYNAASPQIYSGQEVLISGNYGIILRNDGTNFSLLQTNSGNQFGNSWNSYRPFSWNLNTGKLILDASGNGITIGGIITANSNLNVNGANGINILTDCIVGRNQFVTGTLSVTGVVTMNSSLTVTGTSTFLGISVFNTGISILNASTCNSSITFTASGLTYSIQSSSEIQSKSLTTGGQFRAIGGNFGVILRNDGTNFYLLQTPSTTTPTISSFNSYRPFSWNLNSGQVFIDATKAGTIFGGPVTLESSTFLTTASTGYGLANGGYIGDSGATDIVLSTPNLGGLITIPGGRAVAIANFGFLNTLGAGSFSGVATYAMGLYINNVASAAQFNSFSDVRVKENIETLPKEEGLKFVTKSRPVIFNHKNVEQKSTGFIAQEQIKAGFGHTISQVEDDTLEEYTDEENFYSPAKVKLVKNYSEDNAYLVAFGQWVVSKLEDLETRISKLEEK